MAYRPGQEHPARLLLGDVPHVPCGAAGRDGTGARIRATWSTEYSEAAAAIDEAQAVELFGFAGPVQSVTVEVRCSHPLLMREERYYTAEIVECDFVNKRDGLQVSLEDLDEREGCLDALQSEEGAE
ncbi:DUF5959 family protein [Streptomyces griseoincarnatus]